MFNSRQFGACFPFQPSTSGEAKRPLLIEIARRDEDEHVGLDRRKPIVPIFKAPGQMVTSEGDVNDLN